MKLFIERPIATAMFFLALAVLGAYSFLNIPLELAPEEEYPQLDVETIWSGVPPEIVQAQVTAPLEEVASGIKGVRKISSESKIGISRITLEFDPKTNMEFAHLALREKISGLKSILPYRLRPVIRPFVPEDFRVAPFLSYTISGDYSLQRLREMLKDRIEAAVGSVKGVAAVMVSGGADPVIKVELDRGRIKSLNIHPYQVYFRLRARLRTYPAGKVRKGSDEFIFKVHNAVSGVPELSETVIFHSGANPIKLKDIAEISRDYGETDYINRINGQPTIRLTVKKEKGVSTLKVAKTVKARLEGVMRELPEDLTLRTVDDESKEIRKNLKQLYLLVAIIFSVIFLLVLLVLKSIRPSLLVLSSVAFSVLITFNLIYFFKISLNMFTLGGLALGFGLFVDNSIVVFENVLRNRESGMPAIRAAVVGAHEVFLPVLAATLTTMSVFFSFAYFQGRLKIFYLPLAVVISSALAASLLVSFSLIPALSVRLTLIRAKVKKTESRYGFKRILSFFLRHPLEFILVMAMIFIGSYKWFRSEVTMGEFFRWYSKERLIVSVGMPPGTELRRTDEVIKKFEQKIISQDYELEVNTSIDAERGALIITFPAKIEASYRPYLLKEELIQLATNFAGISVGIYGFDPQGYSSGFGSGTFYDSQIKFYGYNLKKLKEITSSLERSLVRNPRIKEVKVVSSRFSWWRLDSFEYILKINQEALKKFDVDPQYLYFHLQSMIAGNVDIPLKGRIQGKEIDISIKFPEAEEMDLKRIQESLIRTRAGEYLRLNEIARLEEKPIAGSIDREDQQFQQTVMWEFRGPSKASQKYRKAVFSRLRLPPGFSATLETDRFMTTEEKGQIRFAIIFSLVLIFMILASLYESLIQPSFILLAVPLALIGVFIAFVIADYPFDSSAYIGVILLGGIVVNNSILLVDHINLKRKQGLPLLEAVLEGTQERIRPILLTTGTTVLGMLPLILIPFEEGKRQIWSTLALSAVGGLTSSTLFILVVIPIIYAYGDGLHRWMRMRTAEWGRAWRGFRLGKR